jgi:hypothetical protein
MTMDGSRIRASAVRMVAACAAWGAMVGGAPADTDGSPAPAGGAYRGWQRSAWREAASLQPPADAAWAIGPAVALHQGMLAVAPARDWDLGHDVGGVQVYRRAGNRWRSVAQIAHPAGEARSHLGAALALSDTELVIGAPHDSDGAFQAGAVFVHAVRHDQWPLVTTLQRPRPSTSDLFGTALAFDHGTLVIGAPKADEGGLDTGAVEVFERDAMGAWIHTQTLAPPDPATGMLFGISVALSGETILVGAPGDSAQGPLAGRVHLYRRIRGSWRWDGSVGCPAGPRSWFGAAVAASDGLLVVGAPRATRPGASRSHLDRGAAWVIERVAGSWRCTDMLAPAAWREGDGFGAALATDGVRVVVGATADSVRGDLSGCAFVFERDPADGWHEQRLDPRRAGDSALIGHGVAVDGPCIAVGRLGDPEADPAPGSVTVFERDGPPFDPSGPHVPVATERAADIAQPVAPGM